VILGLEKEINISSILFVLRSIFQLKSWKCRQNLCLLKYDSDFSIYRKYVHVRDFSGKSNLELVWLGFYIIRFSFFKVCAVCRNKKTSILLLWIWRTLKSLTNGYIYEIICSGVNIVISVCVCFGPTHVSLLLHSVFNDHMEMSIAYIVGMQSKCKYILIFITYVFNPTVMIKAFFQAVW